MNANSQTVPRASASTEMLILPDGKILVHNLTPTVAALLSELNPDDELMKQRSCQKENVTPILSNHELPTGN